LLFLNKIINEKKIKNYWFLEAEALHVGELGQVGVG